MAIPTPCRNICRLDASGHRCTGCGRTLDEIARWATMRDAERQAVLDRLTRAAASD